MLYNHAKIDNFIINHIITNKTLSLNQSKILPSNLESD